MSSHPSSPALLHVHDHGGDGPPLVLLHGAGRSHADWAATAPLLARRHRVLAVDLPGHGRSEHTTNAWTFDGAVASIERVLTAYGIPEAIPVGHSLGGMVTLRYAAQHAGTTPAAVNLDGFWWGSGRSGQYPGLDPATAKESVARIGELMRAAAGQLANADHVHQQATYAGLFGIPYDRAEAAARGAVRELPDDRFQTLPVRERALEMYAALDGLDMMALVRSVPCPVLCVRARRPQPKPPTPGMGMGMEWFEELTAAHARALDRDLPEAADAIADAGRGPLVVEDVDATHAMLLEEPEEIAARVLAFTSRTRHS
ncbi:alpha/beta fold hydrolase [Streptomyces paludis]|uniref:Alpha/beta hydrolase n=1 Tax=Streptomyces paludis TaxID=2282738 RepID=A0A345HU82_9ACTN|nr:alpha/beta hydrolase [Streptomyces paludis]AXG80256.1 alpha/beta hydrolase [Streptomyces paludis]